MTSPGPAFSLSYDLRVDDFAAMSAMSSIRRRRRQQAAVVLAGYGLLAAILTVITVLLDLPTVVRGSTGAPSWMYPTAFVSWLLAITYLGGVVRRSPKRIARRTLRQNPAQNGRHRDEVSDRGITWTGPDGAEVFTPWSALTRFAESDDYFYVYDQTQDVRNVLPKRGLRSPDLIPALREFLSQALGSGSGG